MGLKKLWKSLTKGEAMGATPLPPMEPLECVIKEQKRDEHLKNLGMKRNKSLRRSIAKKLKRKEKRDEPDAVVANERDKENQRNSSTPTQQAPVHVETRTSIGASVDGGRKVEVIQVEQKKDGLIGDTQPLPAHIQNDVPRKMDKLRRSIRHSIRKRKESGVEMSKAQKWQIDEAAVRSGTCSFYVKYLGCCEVFESRGMQVCEAAVANLKEQRRRTIRGTLSISGDSIRVMDEDTKGLILDQTIEKVSFCAPDRNFDRGFSYICRDGTTRRWMCHAFMAVGDSGERLSHAVGCAFGICLEYKQKRDKANVSVNYDSKEASFTRHGSFRPGTMTERLADPQALKVVDGEKSKPESSEENQFAVSRPKATELMYQRQASYRGLGNLAGASPFKRAGAGQLSLRLDQLPSTKERRGLSKNGLPEQDTILEDLELPPSNLEILSECQELNRGIDLLTNEDPFSLASEATVSMSGASGSSTPAMQTVETSSTYSMSPPPSLLQPIRLHALPETPDSEANPWDHVPDQPTSPRVNESSSMKPPSSSTTSTLFNFELGQKMSSLVSSNTEDMSLTVEEHIKANAGTSSGFNSPTSTNSSSGPHTAGDVWQSNIQNSILEDPFDAEWAAIATRNSSVMEEKVGSRPTSTNPFLHKEEIPNTIKAFELQL